MKQLFLASLLAMAGGLLYCNCCHAQNKISAYQYWFDNNYTTNSLVELTPKENQYVSASLPLDEITGGLHVFTIRFKDTNGNWSIPDSYHFYYNCCYSQNKISACQYWFDYNYTTNTLVELTPIENQYVSVSLPLDEITGGLHVFTIRFKDTNGNWSIPDSYHFYKPTGIAVENTMVAWRWWLNDDFEHAKLTLTDPPMKVLYLDEDLDLTELNSGEHTIHFQFKDAAGNWSIVTSDHFTYVKTGTERNTIAKTIKMYPNPSTEMVYFEFEKVLPSVLISVIDCNGTKIQEETYFNTNTAELHLLFTTSGTYVIKINSGDETASYLLVKN